ncbi:YqgE/AlgH family protein [Planctomicrobium sp. SH668]|uniref:YqgE/AlgH family protein n=1 Tax=Planctomicrobium sp. SH668 TaxID=3448126 RepID=UPI003F5BAE3F
MSTSLRGHVLVAGSHLRDCNFFKSTVLIVEDGLDGAMGLVLNRPTAVTVGNVLNGHLDLLENHSPVYTGGPVEPAALFIVHNSKELDPCELAVVPGVYMGSSAEVFESIVCHCGTGVSQFQYRVYCGCAGWGPGQLQDELDRGDWIVVPAHSDHVFSSDPYSLWDELYHQSLQSRRILPVACDHPEWN